MIVDGWAVRYKSLRDGGRAIIAFLIPGDLCDAHVALLDRMDHSIAALSDCSVAYISRDTMRQIFAENSRLAQALFWATLVDEAVLREWLVNIGQREAELRVAHFFCEMFLRSRAVGLTEDDNFFMPLTQVELADTLGLSAVHINRTLKDLRKRGFLTVKARRATIHDVEDLIIFSGFTPNYLHLNPGAQ